MTTTAPPRIVAPLPLARAPSVPAPSAAERWAIRPTNDRAMTSLAWALMGIPFNFFFVPCVIAIVSGHRAIAEIERSRGAERGRGLAVAGLVIGYVELVVSVIVVAGVALVLLAEPF